MEIAAVLTLAFFLDQLREIHSRPDDYRDRTPDNDATWQNVLAAYSRGMTYSQKIQAGEKPEDLI